MESEAIVFRPIGVIRTQFEQTSGVPIQSKFGFNNTGMIELNPEYQSGLQDLDGISHIYLLYHLNRHHDFNLAVKPYLDDQMRGLFATRAPKRPNGIGLSIVEILKISGCRIEFRGVDILNNTPLLDIKPYIKEIDHFEGTRSGWYEKAKFNTNTISDDRF